MTAPVRLESSHARVSVVICGNTLIHTYQALQTDSECSFCFSSDLSSGLRALENLAPSILLVDHDQLQSMELGALRVRLALLRSVRVLVYIAKTSDQTLRGLLRAGVSGFVERDGPIGLVRAALRHVADGEIWAPRRLVSDTFREMVSVVDDPRFTRRELEILKRIAAGEDNRQIAEGLYITRETVRWHLRSAYAKLGVHNRQLAAGMLRHSA
jgi:DNA-binding NarL/FixJ family response regulator